MTPPFGHGLLGVEQTYDVSEETMKFADDLAANCYRVSADMASQNLVAMLDKAVKNVDRQGDWFGQDMWLMACVTYSPSDLGDYHQVPLTPRKRQEWANRVGSLAKRFKGKIKAWEVWNEGNHFPMNTNPNLENYYDLLSKTYDAIKAADPAAIVVTTGTSPRSTDAGGYSPIDWVTGLYKIGPIKCDALGEHPYSYPWPATTQAPWNAAQQTFTIHQVTAWCEAVLKNQGKGDGIPKPIWATEVCFPSFQKTAPTSQYVDENTQAQLLGDLVHMWRAWDFTGPLFWFGVKDRTPPTEVPPDPALWGALYRNDSTPKPSATAFRSLIV